MKPRTALPTRTHRNRGRPSGPLLAALGLLAWLAPPLEAEVIDDFSGPPKWNGVVDPTGVLDYEIVNGQLKMSHPHSPQQHRIMWYYRTYAVPEDRWLELQVDMVSASDKEVMAAIGFVFPIDPSLGSYGGYGLLRNQESFILAKSWGDAAYFFLWEGLPVETDPVTVRLGLRQEGANVRLSVKVAKRDNPGVIVYQGTVRDTPGVDPFAGGTASDPGAPFLGSTVWVNCSMADTSTMGGPAELVIDNFVCSEEPLPASLGVRRVGETQVAVEWQGVYVPFEADVVSGPWRPCPEQITHGAPVNRLPVRFTGVSRFFQLVQGLDDVLTFDPGESGWTLVVAAVKEGDLPLEQSVSDGQLRLQGTGDPGLDFVVRHRIPNGVWCRDSVTSVDITDWDATHEGARFGLLLRVKPPKENWYLEDGLPDPHYAGLLTFQRAGSPSESELALLGPGGSPIEVKRFPAVDPAKQYRLQFSAVGRQLTLQLFDLENLEVPVQMCVGSDDAVSEGMAGMQGTVSASGAFDVTIDRFIVNGSTR